MAAEALRWVGTPFHDQASVRGAGADCKGLLWGVARELTYPEADSVFATFVTYDLRRRGGVPAQLLKQGLASLFDPVAPGAALEPGDVLLLKHGGVAQHLAIVVSEQTAVHAQISPNDRVKEASLRSLLKLCPLDSAWRWRHVG